LIKAQGTFEPFTGARFCTGVEVLRLWEPIATPQREFNANWRIE
jgi:hypothetical protein